MIAIVAAIVFGAPGPEHRVVFHDATVRAEIRYRTADEPLKDHGEDQPPPSIVTGQLTVDAAGRRRTYDLTRLFPTRDVPITMAVSSVDGCGATAPIVHKSHYLALEAIIGEKGCAPIVTMVDLSNGRVAEDVVLDPAWPHRFDAEPESFVGSRAIVTDVQTVSLDFQLGSSSPVTAWPIVIVTAKDAVGRTHDVSFDARDVTGSSATAATVPGLLPSVGQPIVLGKIRNRDLLVVRYFPTQRVLHLSDSDNQKFAAAQTPTPPNIATIAKRNALFSLSYAQAEDGRFDAAVGTFQKMLALETDPTLHSGEALILKRCLSLAREVQAGSRTEAQAAALFSKHDCAPG